MALTSNLEGEKIFTEKEGIKFGFLVLIFRNLEKEI